MATAPITRYRFPDESESHVIFHFIDSETLELGVLEGLTASCRAITDALNVDILVSYNKRGAWVGPDDNDSFPSTIRPEWNWTSTLLYENQGLFKIDRATTTILIRPSPAVSRNAAGLPSICIRALYFSWAKDIVAIGNEMWRNTGNIIHT
ncbi:unnamed protein product [Clonostachys rosea]|uniref:Uncharacterized protein n=1 Tax=Bionectria ochroleuca TaxID=29856 RepID=A0ABY6UJ04_BIOOC|nr:unnamed protein product [Clonostachys rosea]